MRVLGDFRDMGSGDAELRDEACKFVLDHAYYCRWIVCRAWKAPGLCIIGACKTCVPGGGRRYTEETNTPCTWCMTHIHNWASN